MVSPSGSLGPATTRVERGAAIRPGIDELWIDEHGLHKGDELDRLVEGGNYGCKHGDPVGDTCSIGGGTYARRFI